MNGSEIWEEKKKKGGVEKGADGGAFILKSYQICIPEVWCYSY